jgi:hypothetical protein
MCDSCRSTKAEYIVYDDSTGRGNRLCDACHKLHVFIFGGRVVKITRVPNEG